jgi:hypothetical protein
MAIGMTYGRGIWEGQSHTSFASTKPRHGNDLDLSNLNCSVGLLMLIDRWDRVWNENLDALFFLLHRIKCIFPLKCV